MAWISGGLSRGGPLWKSRCTAHIRRNGDSSLFTLPYTNLLISNRQFFVLFISREHLCYAPCKISRSYPLIAPWIIWKSVYFLYAVKEGCTLRYSEVDFSTMYVLVHRIYRFYLILKIATEFSTMNKTGVVEWFIIKDSGQGIVGHL